MGVPSNSDDQRLRCVTEVLRKRHKRCSRGARARGRLHLEEAETARSGHQISRDLNDSGPLLRFQKGTGKETPEPLSRKSDGHPIGPNPTQLSPPPRLNAPRTFEKGPRLRRGGPGVPAPPGSLTEGQQDAAEAQHPQGPHGARPASLKSPLISGAASAPHYAGVPRLAPQAARSAHYPPSGSGRFSPPLLAGGGRETRTHQSCRTTHPLYPIGGSRGGPQFTNRSCPGAVPDARSVAPPDWSVLAPFLQSNGSAGPSHLGPPLCLGWSGL